MIPYGRQWLDEDDIAAVVEVLRSDFLTTGPAVPAFEAELAAVTGAGHAVASWCQQMTAHRPDDAASATTYVPSTPSR